MHDRVLPYQIKHYGPHQLFHLFDLRYRYRYRFIDCMRSRRPFLGIASRFIHCTDGHYLVLHLLLLGQSCDRDLQD